MTKTTKIKQRRYVDRKGRVLFIHRNLRGKYPLWSVYLLYPDNRWRKTQIPGLRDFSNDASTQVALNAFAVECGLRSVK